jgi:hypothetical protein
MMTAEGDTFEEPSPKWSRFYAHHGWATAVPDEPPPEPRRRWRPRKVAGAPEPQQAAAEPVSEPEPDPAPEPAPPADPLDGLTNSALRALAEQAGHELPAGYVRNDDLIALLKGG